MSLTSYRLVSRVALALGASLLALSGCVARPLDSSDSSEEEASTHQEGLSGAMPVGAVLKATSNVNLRSGPSTSNSILTVISVGSAVTVQASAPSGGFYQISYSGLIGW